MEVRMDEATPTIAPQHSAVIAVLARQSAIKAVKEQLRRQGLKPAHIAKREIVAIAEDYLAQHRQAFLEQTAERVRTSPALRALSESNASASADLFSIRSCLGNQSIRSQVPKVSEMVRCMIIIAICCVAMQSSYAQSHFPALSKLKQIQLAIILTEDAVPCGITQKMVRDAFMYSASSAKLVVADASSDSWYHRSTFVLRIATFRSTSGICTSAIDAELVYLTKVDFDFSGESYVSRVLLWDSGWVGLDDSNGHGQQIKTEVENLTKLFITEWNLANK
jgi:hypothetical protein